MKPTFVVLVLAAAASLAHFPSRAHGDVTPQAVDTKELPALGADWRADTDNKPISRLPALSRSAGGSMP